jgi:hypothetical protein
MTTDPEQHLTDISIEEELGSDVNSMQMLLATFSFKTTLGSKTNRASKGVLFADKPALIKRKGQPPRLRVQPAQAHDTIEKHKATTKQAINEILSSTLPGLIFLLSPSATCQISSTGTGSGSGSTLLSQSLRQPFSPSISLGSASLALFTQSMPFVLAMVGEEQG